MSQRKDRERDRPQQAGVDVQLARKERARKTLKLGRERRASYIHRHRKVMDDESMDDDEELFEGEHMDPSTCSELALPPHFDKTLAADKRLRRMLEMRTALYDPDPTVHFPACVYFRKSLAIDQHPPLDLVHACGVVPRLVELLYQSQHNIQYECAWFLTNMACGQKNILEDLLATNLVPLALKLMVSSSNEDVREQCLWLLCNLASSADVTRDALIHYGLLPITTIYMKLSSSSIRPNTVPSSQLLESPHRMEEFYKQVFEKEGVSVIYKNPSLLAMTHLANLISYLVRKDLPLPGDDHSILFIVKLAPTLLQSPDDNVVVATCTALINIYEGTPAAAVTSSSPEHALELSLEKGVMRRMKDISCSSASSDAARQAALSVLATVLKAENPLHRLVVLRAPPSGFQLLECILSHLRILDIKEEAEEALSGNNISNNEFYLHVLNCLSVMLLESPDSQYADQLIRGDLHLLLISIIRRNNNFEVSSQVGRCICSLLLRGSVETAAYMGPTLFPAAMTSMATSQDLHLVLLSLSSTWHLVQLHSTFDFLVDAALDDHFYDTMSTISTGAMDDDIRCMASLILDFADRVRND